VPGADGNPAIDIDDRFWKELNPLVNDEIIDVRISLARFITILRSTYIELTSVVRLTSDALLLEQLNFFGSPILLY